MKYQRKQATVEAARLDPTAALTLPDGTAVPAGDWIVFHTDGRVTSCTDTDFTGEYEPVPEPVPVPDVPDAGPAPADAAVEAQPA